MQNILYTQKIKFKPKLILICKNCLCIPLCVYCTHRTVLTIFLLIPQTIVIAQMLSVGGTMQIQANYNRRNCISIRNVSE